MWPTRETRLALLPNWPEGRSIVLIGLMGAGKTVAGRRLAARLGLPFTDADTEIEAAAGCTISEIFERYGEPAFREGERKVIARLLDGPMQVLATGGGAFMERRTREVIRRRGVSVWLRADLDLLYRRTAGRNHRPLLRQGEPRRVLEDLIGKRYPIYAEADVTVDAWEEPPDATVDRIIAALRDWTAPRSSEEHPS